MGVGLTFRNNEEEMVTKELEVLPFNPYIFKQHANWQGTIQWLK